jgi:hypothetical protein
VLTVLLASTDVSAKSQRGDYCRMIWEELEPTISMIHQTNDVLDKEYQKPRANRSEYMKEYEQDVVKKLSESADLSTIWSNACKDHH